MPEQCSYCKNGFNERRPLAAATPEGSIARKMERNEDEVLENLLKDPGYWPDDGEKVVKSLDVDLSRLFGEGEELGMGMDMEDLLNGECYDEDAEVKGS